MGKIIGIDLGTTNSCILTIKKRWGNTQKKRKKGLQIRWKIV